LVAGRDVVSTVKTSRVSGFVPRTVSAAFCPFGLLVCLSTAIPAAAQEPAQDLPVSMERIQKELSKRPSPLSRADFAVERPVATFRTRVEQRVYMVPFKEWLDKKLELTELQRQSADWASRCCGIDLGLVFKPIEQALERRKLRKVREQIAGELAELEAARKKAAENDAPGLGMIQD
jgi:hypothetical protein